MSRISFTMFLLIVLFSLLINVLAYPSALKPRPPRLVFISMDGFRADYCHPELTPFLFSLRERGSLGKEMRSMFPSKTFPNHFSMVTGLYPEEHGIISNYMYDPNTHQNFSTANTERIWWDNGRNNPIWNLNQYMGDGRYSGVVMFAGGNVPINNTLAHFRVNYARNRTFANNFATMIDWMNHKTTPANLIVSYFPQPDKNCHKSGPFSQAVRTVLKELDNAIADFFHQLEKEGLSNSTNVIIVSDHGMSEIQVGYDVDLGTVIQKYIDNGLIAIGGQSPIFFFNLNDKNYLKEVYNALKEDGIKRHYTVYLKDEIPSRFHFRRNPRILDILVMADDGYNLKLDSYWKDDQAGSKLNDSINQWKPWSSLDNIKGMKIIQKFEKRKQGPSMIGSHGLDPELNSLHPFFIAVGPAFKKQFIMEKKFQIIDIYPLMCEVLHIPNHYCISSGTLQVVHQFLKPLITVEDTPAVMLFLVFGSSGLLLTAMLLITLASNTSARKRRLEASRIDLNDDVVNIDIAPIKHPLDARRSNREDSVRKETVALLNSKYQLLVNREDDDSDEEYDLYP